MAVKAHGRSDASMRTDAPAIGLPEPESVMNPWMRPSGPEALAGPAATSNRTKAGRATRSAPRDGQGEPPRPAGPQAPEVESRFLKGFGPVIGREAEARQTRTS